MNSEYLETQCSLKEGQSGEAKLVERRVSCFEYIAGSVNRVVEKSIEALASVC